MGLRQVGLAQSCMGASEAPLWPSRASGHTGQQPLLTRGTEDTRLPMQHPELAHVTRSSMERQAAPGTTAPSQGPPLPPLGVG